jgi:PAP2 superfamily
MATHPQPFQYWGPALCLLGAASILVAAVLRCLLPGPSVLSGQEPTLPPTLAMRLEVYFGLHGLWAFLFGAVIWRGVRPDGIDLRTAAERRWSVWEPAEWIYLWAYLIPLVIPWLPRTRAALRQYSLLFLAVLAASLACFVLLPWYSPPRPFEPTSGIGRILAWETGRANFAAASFPSFHVLWALFLAGVLAPFGRPFAWAGVLGVAAMMVACVANGSHAIVDVVASVLLYLAARWTWDQAGRRRSARAATAPTTRPASAPPRP